MNLTKKSSNDGLLARALSLNNSPKFEIFELDFYKLYNVFNSISNLLNSQKSMLLFLDEKKEKYLPLYHRGYDYSTFSRISIPKEFSEFIESKKFYKQFSFKDRNNNNKIYKYYFKINTQKFIFFTTEHSQENEIKINKKTILNYIENNKNSNNKSVLLQQLIDIKQKELTVTYITTKYNSENLNEILKNERELYEEISLIFSNNSVIIRTDFGKIIVVSYFSEYPEPSTFKIHIEDLLNTQLSETSINTINTLLLDTNYTDISEIFDYYQ